MNADRASARRRGYSRGRAAGKLVHLGRYVKFAKTWGTNGKSPMSGDKAGAFAQQLCGEKR